MLSDAILPDGAAPDWNPESGAGAELVLRAMGDALEMRRILDEETMALLERDWGKVLRLADGKQLYAQRLEAHLQTARDRWDQLRSLSEDTLMPLTELQLSLADSSRRNMEAVARAARMNDAGTGVPLGGRTA